MKRGIVVTSCRLSCWLLKCQRLIKGKKKQRNLTSAEARWSKHLAMVMTKTNFSPVLIKNLIYVSVLHAPPTFINDTPSLPREVYLRANIEWHEKNVSKTFHYLATSSEVSGNRWEFPRIAQQWLLGSFDPRPLHIRLGEMCDFWQSRQSHSKVPKCTKVNLYSNRK